MGHHPSTPTPSLHAIGSSRVALRLTWSTLLVPRWLCLHITGSAGTPLPWAWAGWLLCSVLLFHTDPALAAICLATCALPQARRARSSAHPAQRWGSRSIVSQICEIVTFLVVPSGCAGGERSWCKGKGARQRAKWVCEVVRIEERPKNIPFLRACCPWLSEA